MIAPIKSEMSPMKRSCPSVSSVSRRNAWRQVSGASSGNSPSSTSSSPHAARKLSATLFVLAYLAPARGAGLPAPDCLKYWKNSEFGSSTITSLLLRNVALYVSRLR